MVIHSMVINVSGYVTTEEYVRLTEAIANSTPLQISNLSSGEIDPSGRGIEVNLELLCPTPTSKRETLLGRELEELKQNIAHLKELLDPT